MSSDQFFVVATVIAAFAAMVAVISGKPPKKGKDPPREVTRWKRFRVNPANVRGARREPTPVVQEEPKGLKLLARREASGKGIRVADAAGGSCLEVAHRWRPFSRRYRIRIKDGSPMELIVPKGGAGKMAVEAAGPGDRYELRGDVGLREYEIRKNGKIVGLVSWQRATPEDPPADEYILETLKTEDELPLVALALAVEAADA